MCLSQMCFTEELGGRVKRSGDCGDIWVDGDTLFAGIAALAAGGAYLIYMAATMMRRRKKRDSIPLNDDIQSIIQLGNSHSDVN